MIILRISILVAVGLAGWLIADKSFGINPTLSEVAACLLVYLFIQATSFALSPTKDTE